MTNDLIAPPSPYPTEPLSGLLNNSKFDQRLNTGQRCDYWSCENYSGVYVQAEQNRIRYLHLKSTMVMNQSCTSLACLWWMLVNLVLRRPSLFRHRRLFPFGFILDALIDWVIEISSRQVSFEEEVL